MSRAGDRRSSRDVGRSGEDAVAAEAVARGMVVLDRNATAGGAELDLVLEEPDPTGAPTIVFVEVRGRTHADLGDPLETVDRKKRERLIRGATAWLVQRGLWDRVAVRFDVVGLVGNDESRRIQWIRAAFETDQARA